MKWQQWSQRAGAWSEELREEAREHVDGGIRLRPIMFAAAIVATVLLLLGIYWSREPAPFEVGTNGLVDHPAKGVVTTATLVQVITKLLEKPGGFINNDIAPPGVWLDNVPSWERGALQQARDMMRALRDDFSRTTAAAEPDEDLARAEPRLNFSDSSWMLPSSEAHYREARRYLRAYLTRLQGDGAATTRFATTPESLERYLARVTARLDVHVQRLSACVVARENPLVYSSAVEPALRATTPSSQIDNVFYEARGSAWALLHLLRAIDIDFAEILRANNAQSELQEAIRALDASQETIYSPAILNGSGFGLLANHSLVMASYMARADTAVANVRRLLSENAAASMPSLSARSESDTVEESAMTEQESNR